MVDVGGDDRAPGGDLVADKLGGAVFPQRDVLHFRSDDAAPGIVHLCDAVTAFRADGSARGAVPFLRRRSAFDGGAPVVFEFLAAGVVGAGVVAVGYPGCSQAGEAASGVDVGSHGAVDAGRFVGAGGGIVESDFGVGDAKSVFFDEFLVVLGVVFAVDGVWAR